MPDEEGQILIPFTGPQYGVMLEILTNLANRIIVKDRDDLATGPVDPLWPLIQKHFLELHDAPLPDRPADVQGLLKFTGGGGQ